MYHLKYICYLICTDDGPSDVTKIAKKIGTVKFPKSRIGISSIVTREDCDLKDIKNKQNEKIGTVENISF